MQLNGSTNVVTTLGYPNSQSLSPAMQPPLCCHGSIGSSPISRRGSGEPITGSTPRTSRLTWTSTRSGSIVAGLP